MTPYNRLPVERMFEVPSLVAVFYMRLTKTYRSAMETLSFAQLTYLETGEMKYTVNGRVFVLGAGQLIVVPPGTKRAAVSVSEVRPCLGIVSFDCPSEALASISVTAGDKPLVFTPEEGTVALLREIFNSGAFIFEPITGDPTHRGMKLRDDAAPAELALLGARLELVLTALCVCRSGMARRGTEDLTETRLMGEIKEYLSRRVNSEVSLSDICRDFNLSASFLKRLFRENEGCGAIDYFISRKIDRAKTLIREGRLNFSEIAEGLGFSSLHYFSRLFKSRTGMTPSEYRSSFTAEHGTQGSRGTR